ncbi:hypothetical protein GCM10007036_00280 [Alsobacter metallidurans]|uniref:Uncharacterized protein n=1 Tax=Alsobacter metallidurans TaxID=340221 RepID=A0A917I3C3_9HYPH|nr:hypothetical protein [Alsobacter metallidurans]GGH06039.1 hypothetical protein GCM10007036_00280 [Alsobacter metallidurans]
MRITITAALFACIGAIVSAQAQTTPAKPAGATPQNDADFVAKTSKDPAFAGGEQPKETGSTTSAGPAPAPREGMNYTPTKTPDETTQQAK